MTRLALAAALVLLALTGCATTTNTHAPQGDPQRITSPRDGVSEPPLGQSQAARAAGSYLDLMPMSAKGLRDQLRYDKHKPEDIDYAMRHLDADWDAEAVEAAHLYLETDLGMSRDRLVEILITDGFTREQARHGVAVAWPQD